MLDLRAAIVGPLADLAAAREYAMAYPDPVIPARADGCPVCGAFPEIGAQWGEAPRSYRAWVPSGGRCTAAWHDGAYATVYGDGIPRHVRTIYGTPLFSADGSPLLDTIGPFVGHDSYGLPE